MNSLGNLGEGIPCQPSWMVYMNQSGTYSAQFLRVTVPDKAPGPETGRSRPEIWLLLKSTFGRLQLCHVCFSLPANQNRGPSYKHVDNLMLNPLCDTYRTPALTVPIEPRPPSLMGGGTLPTLNPSPRKQAPSLGLGMDAAAHMPRGALPDAYQHLM